MTTARPSRNCQIKGKEPDKDVKGWCSDSENSFSYLETILLHQFMRAFFLV